MNSGTRIDGIDQFIYCAEQGLAAQGSGASGAYFFQRRRSATIFSSVAVGRSYYAQFDCSCCVEGNLFESRVCDGRIRILERLQPLQLALPKSPGTREVFWGGDDGGRESTIDITKIDSVMTSPLDGIRVLDLTQVMAGPFCTMLLGDLGADVIKIEPPGHGDLSRSMGGARLQLRGSDHAPFLALNRNKRSVVLDLKTEADRELLLALARTADVLVENFRPGVMGKLGLDYQALAAHNPRIIYTSISGFGSTGPYADRPGFDLIAQGMSGVMSVTGEAGGSPVKCGVPISDLAAGLYAVIGIQSALLARQHTGRGQHIEASLFEAALSLSIWEATEYFATGEAPQPQGSAHRLNAPYQAFRTADGYINIAALTAQQWENLCAVLEREDLTGDLRFASNTQRMAHLPELVQEIETALAGADTAQWVERLLEAGVPAGAIQNYEQVFNDEHTHARNMIETMEHATEGIIRTIGFPLKLSETAARVRRPPPLLGEHTDEVLAEIGLARSAS